MKQRKVNPAVVLSRAGRLLAALVAVTAGTLAYQKNAAAQDNCQNYLDHVMDLNFGDEIRVPNNARPGTLIATRQMPVIHSSNIAERCVGRPYLHFFAFGAKTNIADTYSTNITGIGMRIKASIAPVYFSNPEIRYQWPNMLVAPNLGWFTIQPVTIDLIVTGPFSNGKLSLSNIAKYSVNGSRGVVYRNTRETKIITPEVCTINAGQIIQVNLGDVGAGRFGGKGQKPDGYTPVTTSAPVTCNDAAAQRNVRVSLAATPSPDLNTAIRTSNPDVGVVVTDLNDRVVQPNVGTLPLRLQSNGAGSNDGTVTMKAYPVSTTGRPPAQGSFSATATLVVTFD